MTTPGDKKDSGDQDCKSRTAKRKASPEKKTPIKRRRVADQAGPSTSSDVVKGVKRKVVQDEEGTTKKAKRAKLLDHMSGDKEQASSSLDSGKDLNNKRVCAKNGKRKATGDDRESPKKKRRNVDQGKKSVADQKREFQARYVEEHQLGEGGCGAVFAGYRIEDRFPVAIKHIPKNKVYCKVAVSVQHLNQFYITGLNAAFLIIHFVVTFQDESGKKLSVEVAIMLKLAGEAEGSVGISAPVSLLEWFDLGKELILVLERPVPAVDLQKYKAEKGRTLPEDKAKVILKQLVDAVKELEDKHIFHRDIKGENILIETGSDVPRVRIIDFGLSCFVKQRSLYRIFYGTPLHTPPEWYRRSCYRCGPTTVWQMGVVLYEALHARDFSTERFLAKKLSIKKRLSAGCRNFLEACLTTVPEKRPTLEELQLHPWLR
ncbi:serine/threonine-protein kinase pim-2-like isoform X1 [Astatotilapia calliptera]|uniref:serine/threonine-protein kinase pim-2-like isoform X1 n=1 Tax=Astatotilapia calliptera TaxID=8154 RepID=UPI000E41C679|nr:serine/threonine-protein kinase pim-2-like isoform X1 [Astatotilapia calliptera]